MPSTTTVLLGDFESIQCPRLDRLKRRSACRPRSPVLGRLLEEMRRSVSRLSRDHAEDEEATDATDHCTYWNQQNRPFFRVPYVDAASHLCILDAASLTLGSLASGTTSTCREVKSETFQAASSNVCHSISPDRSRFGQFVARNGEQGIGCTPIVQT